VTQWFNVRQNITVNLEWDHLPPEEDSLSSSVRDAACCSLSYSGWLEFLILFSRYPHKKMKIVALYLDIPFRI
jgi:hypothetical protein